MDEKKKEITDISDIFDDKELKPIIDGFEKFKEYEDKKELPKIKNELYKTWEDGYQTKLKDPLAKRFKDNGGLTKKLGIEDEGILKEVAHDFFLEYIEKSSNHTSKEDKARFVEFKNHLKEAKAEGKDAYDLSSNIYHNTIGIDRRNKNSMDKLIKQAINSKMTGAEFLNLLQEKAKIEHVGSHHNKITNYHFVKQVGQHEDVKYRAAIGKMMKDYNANIENHGLFNEIGAGESYAMWKGFKHGDAVDYKGFGVDYKPIAKPTENK